MNGHQLRRVADIRVSNVDKKSYDGDEPVRLVNYVDVYYNDTIGPRHELMTATATRDQIDRFGLELGDCLITKDSETAEDIAVPAYIDGATADMVSGYHLALLRPNRQLLHPRFLFWSLSSRSTREQFALGANGVTRFGLTYDTIQGASIPVPALDQQRRIADFLDDQVARIDNIIAGRQRQAGLLGVAALSTVARDLDFLAQRWGAVPLRRVLADVRTGGTPGPSLDARYGLPWYSPASITASGELLSPVRIVDPKARRSDGVVAFPRRSVLLVGIGATAGRVAVLEDHACGNQQLTALIPTQNTNVRFLFRQLQALAPVLLESAPFTTLPIINNDVVRSFAIVAPPGRVQVESADRWDRIHEAAQQVGRATSDFAQRMTELKRSLITAAVSGEFDVSAADGSRVPV